MSAESRGNHNGNAPQFHRRSKVTVVTLMLFAAAWAFHPASTAAQGPPAALPGVGPVVLDGELDVLYEDYEDDARLVHFLISDNRRIPLHFQDSDAPDLPTGARVRVRGNLADGIITTTSVTTLAVSVSRTIGNQAVLVILFNFSNNTAQPFTPASMTAVNDAVKNFYLENSFGQTLLTFNTAGWFTIAATDATCDYSNWAMQAEAAATKAGVNLAAYDRRIFAFPRASSCNWAGMGNVAGPRSWLNGSYAIRTVAHEQGHNFGNYHSHALKCDSTSCVNVEYGNDRDVLGASGVVGHMNAFQKERLGWLNYGVSPTTQTVSASGDYWIENYETISGSPKALKIWNPLKANYYYLESRARVGYDANVAEGVTLHTASTSGNSSYQVDLAPTTTTWDSTLEVGQLFKDDAIGLSVQTVSANVDGALVRVVFGTIPCLRAAPAVSLSPSSQTGGAGSAVQYNVTVTNKNAATCAPSPFSVSASVPSGWSSSVSGPGLGSLMPGTSTTATLLVTPPAGSSGSYTFSVNAADGGGYSASATASLTILSTLDVSASGSVSGSGKNKSVTLTTSVRGGSQPVSGATVSVTLVSPSGGTTTLSGTTAADGTATLKYSLRPKDPTGSYQAQAVASKNGATGSTTTTVLVP